MNKIISITIILLYTSFSYGQELRDPVKWPFDKNSIWNQPIGSNAIYKKANLGAAARVGVDIGHIIIADYTYSEYQVFNSPSSKPGRCTGTTYLGFNLKVADDWIVPDAGDSPYGDTPNSAFSYVSPDRQTVDQGAYISRCVAKGPVYLPESNKYIGNRKYIDLRGDGLEGGGQGASHMSTIGGTIRLGEFSNPDPIQHAIKINPWGTVYCHYSDEVPGFKWPAISADASAAERYNRTQDPDIVMGSLFAIPPQLTADSIGLQTIPGKKLFYTLQNYGAYFTEDAGWDIWDIIVERNAEKEFEQKFGFSMKSSTWLNEVNKLMKSLYVITNNTPESIGGGGEPRVDLAPDFIPSCTFKIETDGTIGASTNPSGTNSLNLNSTTNLKITNIPHGYNFTGWEIITGQAILENDIKPLTSVTLYSDDVLIRANFAIDTFNLSANILGNGTLEISPELPKYPFDSQIELLALPDSLWEFISWTGDIESFENPLILNIDKNLQLTANFEFLETGEPDYEYNYEANSSLKIINNLNSQKLTIVSINENNIAQSVCIYNMKGNLLKTKTFFGNREVVFNTGEFISGLYVLRVKFKDDNIESYKLAF